MCKKSTLGGANQTLLFPLPLTVLLGCALVVLFFAFGEAHGQLDPSPGEMQVERHQGIARAFGTADQFVDFAGVQQQFA